jgi:hypothetical protein
MSLDVQVGSGSTFRVFPNSLKPTGSSRTCEIAGRPNPSDPTTGFAKLHSSASW